MSYTWIVVGLVGTLLLAAFVEQQATKHTLSWKPSAALRWYASVAQSGFELLGIGAATCASFLIKLKDVLHGYLQDLWPSLMAILLPLWDLLISWTWFVKGYLHAAYEACHVEWGELRVHRGFAAMIGVDPEWNYSSTNLWLMLLGTTAVCAVLFYLCAWMLRKSL
jgi:hypothetical protein